MPTAVSEQITPLTSEELPFHDSVEDSGALRYEGNADAVLPIPPAKPPPQKPDEEELKNVSCRSTGDIEEKKQDIAPLIKLPPSRAPRRRFQVLQQWEGVVTEIGDDSVWADLLRHLSARIAGPANC